MADHSHIESTQQISYPVIYDPSDDSDMVSYVSFDAESSPGSNNSPPRGPSITMKGFGLLHGSPKLSRRRGQESLRSVDARSPQASENSEPQLAPFDGNRGAGQIPDLQTRLVATLDEDDRVKLIDAAASQATENAKISGKPFMVLKDGRSCLVKQSDGDEQSDFFKTSEQWKASVLSQMDSFSPAIFSTRSRSQGSRSTTDTSLYKIAKACNIHVLPDSDIATSRSLPHVDVLEMRGHGTLHKVMDRMGYGMQAVEEDSVRQEFAQMSSSMPVSPFSRPFHFRDKRASKSLSDVPASTTPTKPKSTSSGTSGRNLEGPTPPPKNGTEPPQTQFKSFHAKKPQHLQIGSPTNFRKVPNPAIPREYNDVLAQMPERMTAELNRQLSATRDTSLPATRSTESSVRSWEYSGDETSIIQDGRWLEVKGIAEEPPTRLRSMSEGQRSRGPRPKDIDYLKARKDADDKASITRVAEFVTPSNKMHPHEEGRRSEDVSSRSRRRARDRHAKDLTGDPEVQRQFEEWARIDDDKDEAAKDSFSLDPFAAMGLGSRVNDEKSKELSSHSEELSSVRASDISSEEPEMRTFYKHDSTISDRTVLPPQPNTFRSRPLTISEHPHPLQSAPLTEEELEYSHALTVRNLRLKEEMEQRTPRNSNFSPTKIYIPKPAPGEAAVYSSDSESSAMPKRKGRSPVRKAITAVRSKMRSHGKGAEWF